jgi:hypothetical protein
MISLTCRQRKDRSQTLEHDRMVVRWQDANGWLPIHAPGGTGDVATALVPAPGASERRDYRKAPRPAHACPVSPADGLPTGSH